MFDGGKVFELECLQAPCLPVDFGDSEPVTTKAIKWSTFSLPIINIFFPPSALVLEC